MIGWTLAHPAVHVAIVGSRDGDHVDEALAGSAIDLDDVVMRPIDDLMVDAAPVDDPSPGEM
jgi:aryl-alcohol dehydrogenase-like predicted oxidoreductase